MKELPLNKRLEKITEIIKTEDFLEVKGVGNEILFYIFDYDPKEEMMVREYTKHIIKEFSRADSNRKVIEFDLYKMLIKFLKEEGDFENVIQLEEKEGKEYILKAVSVFINSESYCKRIKEMSQGYDVIFLTGIGKVYPFMRSHNILNNLQQYIDKKPVIIFYPGEYNEQELTLFNRFKDDNYYRAFPLI